MYPENTLIGFQKAIEQGVDGLEIDVQMTLDEEIVVIHDETIDRTTNGTGYVKDLRLEEIQSFSAGVKFAHLPHYVESIWKLERVPTLQEVLLLLKPYDIELNIEIKTNVMRYERIEEKVLSLVKEYGNAQNVIYSSFHLPTLLRIKKINPIARIAWILAQQIPHPIDYMQSLELEGLHLAKHLVLSGDYKQKEMVTNIRVWTVNDSAEINQLLDVGVNALMTDFPEKAIYNRDRRKVFV